MRCRWKTKAEFYLQLNAGVTLRRTRVMTVRTLSLTA